MFETKASADRGAQASYWLSVQFSQTGSVQLIRSAKPQKQSGFTYPSTLHSFSGEWTTQSSANLNRMRTRLLQWDFFVAPAGYWIRMKKEHFPLSWGVFCTVTITPGLWLPHTQNAVIASTQASIVQVVSSRQARGLFAFCPCACAIARNYAVGGLSL